MMSGFCEISAKGWNFIIEFRIIIIDSVVSLSRARPTPFAECRRAGEMIPWENAWVPAGLVRGFDASCSRRWALNWLEMSGIDLSQLRVKATVLGL